jgi:succinate dehydrogenase/fumarate reductase flavoprotein subunit
MEIGREYDVIVVGGGNAALCAAISAAEVGANVLILKRAPEEERGGNTAFTEGLMRLHDAVGPRQEIRLIIHRGDRRRDVVPLMLRMDTTAEADYLRAGGMMPFILHTLTR